MIPWYNNDITIGGHDAAKTMTGYPPFRSMTEEGKLTPGDTITVYEKTFTGIETSTTSVQVEYRIRPDFRLERTNPFARFLHGRLLHETVVDADVVLRDHPWSIVRP